MNLKTNTKYLTDEASFSLKTFLMKLGSALMLPICLLAVMAFFIGLSTFFPLGSYFFSPCYLILINLPILFALSVTNTFANHRGQAVQLTFIFLLVYLGVQALLIKPVTSEANEYDCLWIYRLPNYYFTTLLGFTVLNTSLFGGIVIGLLGAWIYKWKYSYLTNVYLAIPFAIVFSLLTLLIWPFFYWILIQSLTLINQIPLGLNVFVYGVVNRLLLPFGLHSILIPLVTYTSIGGVLLKNGEIVAQGDSAIWLYLVSNDIPLQLAIQNSGSTFFYNGSSYYLSENVVPGQYQEGFFPILIFGFPLGGYAMASKVESTKEKKLILLASITPLLTGITEPFEYLFVFTNPILYLSSAFYVGLSFWLCSILHVSVFLSSGWIIDLFFFGALQNLCGQQTYYWIILLIGPLFSCLYYFTFLTFYQPIKEKKD